MKKQWLVNFRMFFSQATPPENQQVSFIFLIQSSQVRHVTISFTKKIKPASSIMSSSPDWDSGLPASPPPQSRALVVRRGESGSFGSPPQRLGRQSVQQAEPAPTRLRVPRRTLRRLPVQQQLQHGLRVLAVPAVPLQSPSVRLPTDAS